MWEGETATVVGNEGIRKMKAMHFLEFSSLGLEVRLSKLYNPGSQSKDL